MPQILVTNNECPPDVTIIVKHIAGNGTIIKSTKLLDYEVDDDFFEGNLQPGEMITITCEGNNGDV